MAYPRLESALEFWVLVGYIWGYITTLVTWGVAVETAFDGFSFAIILFLGAAFLTFFEVIVPLLAKFATVLPAEHLCSRVWETVKIVSNPLFKMVIYLVIGITSCLKPSQIWLALISGILTLVLAVFSFLQVINRQRQDRTTGSPYKRFDRRAQDLTMERASSSAFPDL